MLHDSDLIAEVSQAIITMGTMACEFSENILICIAVCQKSAQQEYIAVCQKSARLYIGCAKGARAISIDHAQRYAKNP